MRISLALLLTVTLSACSLFGPDVETLETTTLLQESGLVTADLETPGSPRAPFITSEEDEAAFRERYGIAEPFPTVDYATEMVVAVVEQSAALDARVNIDAVELIGDDRARVTYTVSGTPSGGPDRYPLHVVRTRRADLAGRGIETSASFPLRD